MFFCDVATENTCIEVHTPPLALLSLSHHDKAQWVSPSHTYKDVETGDCLEDSFQ